MAPRTTYASSGEASIAYQVVGDGPLDVLFLAGWISQVEHIWESPPLRRFMDRIASFARLILFDRRGTGLSERVMQAPTLEQELADVIAVLDAAGSQRAAVFTFGLGGPTGALLASRHPERVSALAMYASVARTTWAPGYEFAPRREQRAAQIEAMVAGWGGDERPAAFAAGVPDPALEEWWSRLERLAASPNTARIMSRATQDLDVRDVLPEIRVPTLVLHRRDDATWNPGHSHYLRSAIPGARYVELEGRETLPWLGDSEAVVQELQEFLTGGRSGAEPQRALLTVMFTDIVDATRRASELGDKRWRDLLDGHDAAVRGELRRYDGEEVKTIGDSFLATFGTPPSQALRCATAIVTATRELGLDVRVGVHTGECEILGDDVGGMAVHIAARVSALAGAGEVLTSGTVYGTVVGSGLEFEARGFHELRGVSGSWPLFALRSGG